MNLWFQNLLDRFDRMSLRERGLVLGMVVGLMLLAWDQLLMRPLDRATASRKPDIAALKQENERLEGTIAKLAKDAGADPDAELKSKLAALQQRANDLDGKLGGLTQGLVAPHDMVEVLKQVIDHAAPLKLVSLASVPASPLQSKVPGEATPALIYRHGVVLELEGTYPELTAFLHGLQALPVRFFWQKLDLDVAEYPTLHVRLTANTLGQEEAWLGV